MADAAAPSALGGPSEPPPTSARRRRSKEKAITSRGRTIRVFAFRTAVLAWVALIVFWGFYAVDHYVQVRALGVAEFAGPFERYFSFDPHGLSDAISSLAGVNAAVFGIVITVVNIIVQLSADRYTGVARMFVQDRVNVLVAVYYVVACVVGVWVSSSLRSEYVPSITLAAMLSLTTGGLVMMAPYFGYVFWFLEPQNIIDRICHDAVTRVTSGALKADEKNCFAAQADALFALEELTDITNNSISGKDKIIASAAVHALKDLAIAYLEVKPQASRAWFSIGPNIRQNPDFVAMDAESISNLETGRTWFEWKVMRQYLSIYNEALQSMRDINYVIAIDTRYIGEAASKANDRQLIGLVFRFLNSYIRATLNAKDIRTAYNVFNQYRKLVEAMLAHGDHRAAADGVRHMKYYGLVSLEMNLSFVTETVAYDLSMLAQLANELGSPAEGDILNAFLELDGPPFVRTNDKALLGVRKAQVKLAAYYLASGQESRARSIAEDMRAEPLERLLAIYRQLEAVENKEFWEIIDRGQNFEYMSPDQRACLGTFFGWLNVKSPQGEPGRA
ncbi:MAG: hypothetical protein JNJ73_20950 [Hyphomonadaceae bacterium]|nr:hypothetical protein [Hyphomonadaceae bacterium]